MPKEKKIFRDFLIVLWFGIIFNIHYMWAGIRAPSSFPALGFLIWVCGHSPSFASGFTHCLNEFTSSCFRSFLRRTISAKSWEVKHKLCVAQRRVSKGLGRVGSSTISELGQFETSKLGILMLGCYCSH